MKQAAKVEETVGRIEKLTQEAARAARNRRQDPARGGARNGEADEGSGRAARGVRGHVESLGGRKKELETFEERLRALQNGVGDAEARMDAAGRRRTRTSACCRRRVDALGKRFETLFAQADDLTQKQLALDGLAGKLSQLEDLAKKTVWQMDTLASEPPRPRCAAQGHAGVPQGARRGGEAGRQARRRSRRRSTSFAEKMTGFSARTPELEAKLDAIAAKLKLVEEGTQKATRLHESVAELDAQIARVSARVPFVEKLEARINALNTTTADVDRKLEEQLTRRAELDALKVACDGLGDSARGRAAQARRP